MTEEIIQLLDSATKYISIYFGIFLLIVGLIGSLLNLIVFSSLKTFRKSSAAFYLTVMSAVNFALLVTGLLSRIMISGFAVDWTQSSLFYCKCRVYIDQLSILTSLTCICLATIDQFFSTHPSAHWHHRNNFKLARILIVVFLLIWTLHGIPYLFFYNLTFSPQTGKSTCSISSSIFQQYTIYGFLLILSGLIPLNITILFGLLAYRNIKRISHRTVPLFRRKLDKQMTVMVLVHILFDLFTLVPYIVVSIIALDSRLTTYPISNAYVQFLRILSIYLYYMYFVCPFYIYICASARFRQQLVFVLCHVRGHRDIQENAIHINQVLPSLK